MNKKIFLDNNWQFALQSKIKNEHNIKYNKWYPAKVPGTVYHNLLINNLIPDPFYADNELKLQWIAESDWNYTTTFNMPEGFKREEPLYLVFEGIDTIAEVYLNGNRIGSADNMFCSYKYEISEYVEKKNKLEVIFTSPYKYAKELEKRYGQLRVALNSERTYIRKAQYSFGWDWGPAFADMGIWKPVYLLQEKNNTIKSLTVNTISIEDSKAKLELNISFKNKLTGKDKILININDDNDSRFTFEHSGSKNIKEIIEINNPELWWPNGEGDQHLYELTITLLHDEQAEDILTKKIGIRTIELQLKEDDKNTFRFIVNGRKIFAKGCNWIPSDSFITRIDDKKYSALLTMAKDAHMNFIRVWGGGFYENDKFYEICDELGLLVWQDFMFACAAYPEHEEYMLNVAEEIKQNVFRLQYHPSIAIWCGNNENEWIWFQEQKKSYKEMPGYKIYSRLIPNIVKEIDPGRAYWESSPFSFDEDPNSTSSGNRHQWDLWSRWTDYNKVKYDDSLFVTEFGFQGPANQSTFEKVIPKDERTPQSYLFEFHNKQVEGNERQFKFMSGHLPVKTKWEDFIYLAQLSQGLALKNCVEHWRYNFPHTNGSIIWQLNDCWPVSSWALVDSDLKPKLSYYLVKETFKHQIIKFISEQDKLNIFLLNTSVNNFSGYFELHEIKIPSGKVNLIKKKKVNSTGFSELLMFVNPTDDLTERRALIAATLYDNSGKIISRNVFSYSEWKYLNLPSANIKTKLKKDKEGDFVLLKSDKPAFYVSLYNDNALFSSNGITILPGEEIILRIKNTEKLKTPVKVFSLNDYL